MRQKLSLLAGVAAFLAASLISTQAANLVTFREGVNGYAGTQDTFISSGSRTTDRSISTTIEIDQEPDGGEFLLLRFDNIFGPGTNQIPLKARILYATLTVTISNTGNGPLVHRMLVPWQETSTWDSLVDGVLADDIEASAIEDATFPGNGSKTVIPLLVTTLQAWSDGTRTNYGWIFLPTGTDGTDFSSSEHSTVTDRPLLSVVWSTVDEPFVTSVTPLNGDSNIPVDANIQLVVRDSAAKLLKDSSVLLFVNGQSVKPTVDRSVTDPAETIIAFDPPANFSASTRIPIRLVFSDTATPARFATNDFSFTTRANTAVLVAIDDKQVWRYDRSATDLGTAWKEKTFNDSAWPQGMALLADETGNTPEPIRTDVPRFNDAGDYVSTFYFRTHFNYTGPLGGELFLRHVIDDGAIFYLNGVEIHRFGYAAGVVVAFNNNAATGHEAAYEGPFTIPGFALVAGDNVLAVEVHQSGTGSSDFVFGAELIASISDIKPTSLVSVSPAANATQVAANTPIEITLADGSRQVQTASVQLSVNGQAVTATVSKPAGSLTTKITYAPASGLAPNSTIAVKLVYGDNATPPNLVTNQFSFATKGVTLVNIDDKQKWRYDRSGVDLGTAWKEKAFNDSAWPEGPALLADETGVTAEPIRTPISRMDDTGTIVPTIYFRTHFNFSGDPKTAQLSLRHVVDDGAVFYLNGVEIHRFGLAAGATYDYTTYFAGHENAYSGPFSISIASLVQGDNVLAVEVHQSDGASSDLVFGAELQVVAPPPVGTTTLTLVPIDANQKWRYENTGKDLGTTWKDKAFNDSAWLEGPALLALETGTVVGNVIRTTLTRQSPTGANIITDYFRTHFTFTGDPATTKLQIRQQVDDGLILYLNGTEVYRYGLAAGAAFTSATFFAGHEGKDSVDGPFDIPSGALVVGDNVLAAEVHQSDATSSDVVFGIELKAIVTGTTSAQPKFSSVTRSAANIVVAWTGSGTLQSAAAVTGPWTDVANASSPFTAPVSGAARFYRIRQ